jgi:hypothetical protein
MLVVPSPKKHTATGPGRACGDRHVRTNDRVRAHRTLLDVHQVHRAALAAQQSAFAPHEFTQDGGHRNTAHQCVVVPAIGAKRIVVLPHGGTESCCHGLLSERQVRRAFDQVLHEQIVGTLFHHAAGLHQAVKLEAGFGIGRPGVLDGSRQLPNRVIQVVYLYSSFNR